MSDIAAITTSVQQQKESVVCEAIDAIGKIVELTQDLTMPQAVVASSVVCVTGVVVCFLAHKASELVKEGRFKEIDFSQPKVCFN